MWNTSLFVPSNSVVSRMETRRVYTFRLFVCEPENIVPCRQNSDSLWTSMGTGLLGRNVLILRISIVKQLTNHSIYWWIPLQYESHAYDAHLTSNWTFNYCTAFNLSVTISAPNMLTNMCTSVIRLKVIIIIIISRVLLDEGMAFIKKSSKLLYDFTLFIQVTV